VKIWCKRSDKLLSAVSSSLKISEPKDFPQLSSVQTDVILLILLPAFLSAAHE